MTRDTTTRSVDGAAQAASDADLLAGLWEEAPFARLPYDAPAELREWLEDVDNPRRVYAIHRASRRHGFQLLVQRYITQLRDGCGDRDCCTPTCFTCRKRIIGRAPIRRYNTTSARTLAVYLASQDNPEAGLCPTLKLPKAPPAALNSLLFSPKHAPSPSLSEGRVFKTQNGFARGGSPKNRSSETKNAPPQPSATKEGNGAQHRRDRSGSHTQAVQDEELPLPGSPKFTVAEKPSSKDNRSDYRSFAANMFGTVAFKMLEWLTPSAIEDMAEKAQKLQGDEPGLPEKAPSPAPRPKPNRKESRSPSPRSGLGEASANGNDSVDVALTGAAAKAHSAMASDRASPSVDGHGSNEDKDGPQHRLPSHSRSSNPRRNSNARVLAPSATRPTRKLSVDAFPSDVIPDDLLPPLRSPRLSGIAVEKSPARALKPSTSTIPRPISQLSNAGLLDGVSLEKMPPLKPCDVRSKTSRNQAEGSQQNGYESPRHPGSTPSSQCSADGSPSSQSTPALNPEAEAPMDAALPQTLRRLNAELVDFVCDVLQEDHTAEQHFLEPPTVTRFHTKFASQPKSLKRRHRPGKAVSVNLKLEWKLFVEQSIFYVLSDPHALIQSFTKKGQLYDSLTLWYCMLRLTRAAPSLVFHSLWMAAETVFAPPKAVQSLRSPTARLFPKPRRTLSNTEAGILLSICLHALIAAAPHVHDARELDDISRIRSHGLSLAGSGAVARQPAELCLQYDDAFSNDLAMRLARRTLAAITTRRYFDELVETDTNFDHVASHDEPDVLSPLFAQLDFLNMDAVYILNFPFADRAFHEMRVPALLLDWARAVMLNDWDGNPEVPGDGPFGGALALIEAIYNRRKELLVGDVQFRSEYFAERLDEVQMPVAWLSFTSTKQKLHLLDFPYIFNPSTLVSYFRSINFSRMSRSFEESSSLQSRMNAIVSPGSLIINPHHKNVLQDLLKTASSKYLILDIGRKSVIKDSFDQLWRREERELMRPLKVHLGEDSGEEGFDSGGVQQEFFRLAMAEALNADFGAFTVDDRTRMAWFNPGTLEPDWKYELVGLLVSLAVYNGLTLPVTFPKAMYRKLLGEPVNELHHIDDGWPDLASGLTKLLEWDEKDGAVEDVFMRTYEFSADMLGQPVSRDMTVSDDMWPQFPKRGALSGEALPSLQDENPADAPLVTHGNRDAFVSDYIRYLTDVSVRPQYEAFARGFRRCLHPKSLTLLTPALLQSVVEGQQHIDVGELRRYTRYVGWDAGHRAVRDFWSIVRRYDDTMKRRLLEFVTASDRVPVGGMKNIQFVVQKNGEEKGEGRAPRLPTAYTCYGTLLLPEYRDREVLRERLAMALENAQGFGFA